MPRKLSNHLVRNCLLLNERGGGVEEGIKYDHILRKGEQEIMDEIAGSNVTYGLSKSSFFLSPRGEQLGFCSGPTPLVSSLTGELN